MVRYVAVGLTLLLLLIGGSIFFSNRQSKSPLEEVKKPKNVKLAYFNSAALIPVIGARKGGFFEKHDIEVEEIKVQKTADALASKSVDVAMALGFVNFLTASTEGHKLVWIASVTNNSPVIVVSRVPKDKVKKVGVTSIGALDYHRILIATELIGGIDTANLTFVTLADNPGKLAAFAKEEIDLTDVFVTEWPTFQKAAPKETTVLLDWRDVSDTLFPLSIVSHEDVMREKRQELISFLSAILEGSVYVKQHPSEIAEALVKDYGFKQEMAEAEVKGFNDLTKNLSFVPSTKPVETILNLLNTQESKTYNPSQFMNDEMAKKVLEMVNYGEIQKVLNE